MPGPLSGDVLTDDDLAESLCCTVETVREGAKSGDLPGIKFGRGWVFPRAAVLERLSEKALAEATARRAPTVPAAVLSAPQSQTRRQPPELPAT